MVANDGCISAKCNKKIFLYESICCGCSKEPAHLARSFEHPKQMLKVLMNEKIFTILRLTLNLLI